MSHSRTQVKVIIFDAVGTVIKPRPAAWEVYTTIARKHGGPVPDHESLRRRFVAAFLAEEEADRLAEWRTDEARERQRWHRIVRTCLAEIEQSDTCFADLFAHFATSAGWGLVDGVTDVLDTISRRGLTIGIGSNFDSRLRAVVAGMPELARVVAMEHLFISSEIGWRKPSKAFFDAIISRLKVRPEEILFVGDDRDNDYDGARAAGLQAVLLDPTKTFPKVPERITSMSELLRRFDDLP